MSQSIASIKGWEVLDSRGRPTVAARVEFKSGAAGEASVPSGASTGTAEAVELRDGDPARFGGLGCRKAAENISSVIARAVGGKAFEDQTAFDRFLTDLDGTVNKSRLGANAILACSIAFARATAAEQRRPLFAVFASIAGIDSPRLPRLTINLFSGGKHAGGQVPIQDVLMVPLAQTIDESLAAAYAVYYAAAKLGSQKYGSRPLKADEGGLAPPFESIESMFDDAVASIRAAGLEPGRDMALAVDVASSHFYSSGQYHFPDGSVTAQGMIDRIGQWASRWPIVSVEDGLAEDDWNHWPALCRRLGNGAITLGDDLLCTNPSRIRKAVDLKACNALLLKVNQIGTLTEAADSLKLARASGWKVAVSARSGETEDDWLADLACGWAGDFIKVGSICQSERLAKYNRLLRLEREAGLLPPAAI